MENKTKLWLDDLWEPPDENWHHTYTSKETIEVLKENNIEHLSLDYDLGFTQKEKAVNGDGGEVTRWLSENKDKRPCKVSLHSHNSTGRHLMAAMLIDAGYYQLEKKKTYILT